MAEITNYGESLTGRTLARYIPGKQLVGMVLDQYTPIIGNVSTTVISGLPRWLPEEHRRRIHAYDVLTQLFANVDPAPEDQSELSAMRQGLPAYIVQVLRDLTIGAEQTIEVEGAAEQEAGQPEFEKQQRLNDWAKRNNFYPKLQSHEEQAGLYGDSYLRIRAGRTKGKPDCKIDVLHPMFCFPEFDRDDHLVAVSLIWEEMRMVKGTLVPAVYKDEYAYINGKVYETAGWYLYTTSPSLQDLKLDEYDQTADGRDINELDLGLTAIPVYPLMNYWSATNYGVSDLAYVIDLCTESNASDTDMKNAARLLGLPPMVVSEMVARVKAGTETATNEETIGAGKIIHVKGQGGKAEYLDNSKMLDCLLKYHDLVENKLFRNTRLGKLFSGQTENIRDIESAKAFKTLLASLYARVTQKRKVRTTYYSELMSGVVEILKGLEGSNNYSDANVGVTFGNILPLDNSDDLRVISEVWASGKGFISAETAAKWGGKYGTGVVDFKKESAEVTKQLSAGKSDPANQRSSFTLGK